MITRSEKAYEREEECARSKLPTTQSLCKHEHPNHICRSQTGLEESATHAHGFWQLQHTRRFQQILRCLLRYRNAAYEVTELRA